LDIPTNDLDAMLQGDPMTTITPPLAQLLGQTEKSLNALLDRLLDGSISEPEWVTLVLLAGSEGPADRDQLIGRTAAALKTDPATAADHVARLTAKGLVDAVAGTASALGLTEAGQKFLGRVRRQVADTAERLWGDLPAADLDTTGQVLGTILERAETELRSARQPRS
jgi:DNA-binding MarR family transcriptional regulator